MLAFHQSLGHHVFRSVCRAITQNDPVKTMQLKLLSPAGSTALRLRACSSMCCMLIALAAARTWAQDEGDAKATPAKQPEGQPTAAAQQNMLRWVYEAEGVFFFPQLAISILVVTMIAWYAMQMQTGNFVPQPFVAQFDNLFKEKKFQEAYELAKRDESFLAKMVAAGISRLSVGYQQAIEATQEVADDESMKHEHRLSYLAMIANLATMVGLLGTVWGMVASFMVISRSDTAPRPSELATGVSQALCTTVAGLLQAIPATLAFTILKNRAARLGFEAGMACEQIMIRFAGVAKKPSSHTTTGV
jgi:biopolymer transport protein ExbB